jgi:hypothetical protein
MLAALETAVLIHINRMPELHWVRGPWEPQILFTGKQAVRLKIYGK